LIYEQHPTTKEEENITFIVILPLQAAGFKELFQGHGSGLSPEHEMSLNVSSFEENFNTIGMVFSTI